MAGESKGFVLYRDGLGEWRWMLYAANAKKIADGSEGYKNRADAIHGIRLVASVVDGAGIWDAAQKTWISS